MNWISVHEQVPDDGKRVLAYVHGISEVGMYSYCDGEWRWMFNSGWAKSASDYRDGVTHWMPLPEPPVTPHLHQPRSPTMKHDDGMPEFFDDLFDTATFWLCAIAFTGFFLVALYAAVKVVQWFSGWW